MAARAGFSIHGCQATMGGFIKTNNHMVTRPHRTMTARAIILLSVERFDMAIPALVVLSLSRIFVMAAKRLAMDD
jgi:hypothetical protein